MLKRDDPAKAEFKLDPAETPPKDARPPAEFPLYDESIPYAYRCPKCAYVWSGKPK